MTAVEFATAPRCVLLTAHRGNGDKDIFDS